MSEERLKEIFTKKANECGFTKVTIDIAKFADLKFRWAMTTKEISLQISDYIVDADDEVLQNVADVIFDGKIFGENIEYSKDTIEFLSTNDFVKTNQPKYLNRIRRGTSIGQVKDLDELYSQMVRDGWVREDKNICLMWAGIQGNGIPIYRQSALMHVVILMDDFDSEVISDDGVKYAILVGIREIVDGLLIRSKEYLDKLDERIESMKDVRDELEKQNIFFDKM